MGLVGREEGIMKETGMGAEWVREGVFGLPVTVSKVSVFRAHQYRTTKTPSRTIGYSLRFEEYSLVHPKRLAILIESRFLKIQRSRERETTICFSRS